MMQITDSYQEIIEMLDFVHTKDQAGEVTKAILGMISSSLTDQEARELAAQLPDYLDYETLRGEPQEQDNILPEECIEILRDKFSFDENQARAVLNQVIGITVREAKGEVSDLVKDLDNEWKEYFDQTPGLRS
ncbi:MAG: DUF2267 domain-containing protein [Bacteroidetes bacterium]|jgi:uncharacterized protein (DUF2267 family)|nr:DUF2267 domain-containing protein [Bacteroidota bacterium]